MLKLTSLAQVRRLLCIGAHADDIEIGCGATILRLLREARLAGEGVSVTWCVMAGDEQRQSEARRAADLLLADARDVRLVFGGFRDAYLPGSWAAVKAAVGALRDAAPEVILTHGSDDRHQDHRLLAELTGQTFRRGETILSYEIPKYDGDLGRPNVFAPASADDVERKCRVLDCFRSQRDKGWFDDETFRGLMRLRGVECASPTRYAEAFYCAKFAI